MKLISALVSLQMLVTAIAPNVAQAQSSRRVEPQLSGGYGSRAPEGLAKDLAGMQIVLDGLTSQINELSDPQFIQRKRIHPDKAREFLDSAIKSRSRMMSRMGDVQALLEESQALVAANAARKDQGSIIENNAKIAGYLNEVDSRFGQTLLPPRVNKLYTYFGKNDADMKEFENAIRQLLATGQHAAVLKLFKALDRSAFEPMLKEMNQGRRYNNTLDATKLVLLDTLFVKNLPESEELQKLRADIVKSIFETADYFKAFADYYTEGTTKMLHLSNLVSHLYEAKLTALGLNPHGVTAHDSTSRRTAVSALRLSVASTSPVNLEHSYTSYSSPNSSSYAEAGVAIASLAAARTQGDLLDYSIAALLAGNYASSKVIENFKLIIDNFPKYQRRDELKSIVALAEDSRTEKSYQDSLSAVKILKKSVLQNKSGQGIKSCRAAI